MPTPVYFSELAKNERFRSQAACITLGIGVAIHGHQQFFDLPDLPHLLIAGSPGSGKSVFLKTIIASILYQAQAHEVKTTVRIKASHRLCGVFPNLRAVLCDFSLSVLFA
ncbi:MAG: hypothetical protein HQM09_24950 [Candidatus Riflebacteria bacterium]|nr:hypothetical protein [Candidatus Riflebacteria bacterium]